MLRGRPSNNIRFTSDIPRAAKAGAVMLKKDYKAYSAMKRNANADLQRMVDRRILEIVQVEPVVALWRERVGRWMKTST